MKRARFGFVVGACALVQSGCGVDAAAPGMSVRDSAGVRIVEYAEAPTAAVSLSLSPEPLFRHGQREGDHLFARVALGALLPDGGAVVADVGSGPGGANELLLFGPDGQFRSVLARSGQGPAEVRQVLSVHVIGGDTLLVEDDGNGKLMIFVDTAFVQSYRTAVDPSLVRALRVLDVDESRRPLMYTSSYRSDFTVPWLPGRLVRLDPETMTADTVASYDMASYRPPDGPSSPGHSGLAAGSGGQFVHLRTDVPELIWRGPDGGVRQILHWAAEPRYPTEADNQRLKESLASDLRRVNPDMPEARLQEFVAERVEQTALDPSQPLPMFREIRGDGAGGVWMGEFVPIFGIVSLPSYQVVDADGTWLGTVAMPERFRVLDVAYGRVLGSLTDELGVESVAVFELRRGPAGS